MKNNLVPVKHDEGDRIYLFRVPETQYLFCGTRVIVDTKKGKKYGTCAADLFNVADDDLDSVCKMYGTTAKDLRSVIGMVCETIWESDKAEDVPADEDESLCFLDEKTSVTVVVNEGLVAEVYADDPNVFVKVIDLDNRDDDSAEIAYKKLMKDVESGKMNDVF